MPSHTRNRWLECETIAANLTAASLFPRPLDRITKQDVMNYLWKDIKEAGILQDCLNNDKQSLERIIDLPGWTRFLQFLNTPHPRPAPRSSRREKTWYRVRAPYSWRPKVGDELIGEYMGYETKEGQFGQYRAHMIKLPSGIIRYVSGMVVNDLFALVQIGTKIKLIFKGKQKVRDADREYKTFELYTEQELEFKLTMTA